MGKPKQTETVMYEWNDEKKEEKYLEIESNLEADQKATNDLLLEYLKRDDAPRRLELLKAYQGGAPVTGENGLRRKLAAFDLEYFGRAYFPHYFTRPSPTFHRDLDEIWTAGVMKGFVPESKRIAFQVNKRNGCRRAVAAPRGHAKSTNLTFKDTLHAAAYQYKNYIIILSDSTEQAEGFLESIRVEMEENEALLEDFGVLMGSKVWKNSTLLTKTGVKLEAIGSGKKVRGRKHRNWRPDLIILDDVENDENVRTAEQRRKLHSWFTKAVSKAGDSYTDIVVIGTILHYDALLPGILKNSTYTSIKYRAVLHFADNAGLWDEWEDIYNDLDDGDHEGKALTFYKEHEAEMLKGTSVLWKEKNSYYDLMVQRLSDGPAAFNSELQNEPINPEDCLFLPEWITFYNESEVDFSSIRYQFFAFVDPSLGKSKKSDTSAIIILGKDKESGYMDVETADIVRRHPDQIIQDILEHERRLRRMYGKKTVKWGVETNQFQWFLSEQLKKASAKAGLYLPLVEVNQSTDKVMRIQTLQPDIKNGYIRLNKRHRILREQLEQFPMGAHDDGPDALQGAVSMAKSAKKWRTLKRRGLGI